MEITITEDVTETEIFPITADAAGEMQGMTVGAGTETGIGIGKIPAGEALARSLHPEVLADVKKKIHKEARKQEDESPPVTLLRNSSAFRLRCH